ncbi:MAG: hypothetical protein GXO19_05660 [Epsilonproteobacteria bacterium]|nr:hypothetical protein [Campylobacterota bacterium]NPA57203.1 hypothetical protein [Campylobacterota bacterium]
MLPLILSLLPLALWANIFAGSGTKHSMEIKGDFAETKQCIRCHLDIYMEYKGSRHYNSIPERDPIHGAIFQLYSKATGSQEYKCARCHAPAVKERRNPKGDPYYHEAIACAYCHRIERVERGRRAMRNIIHSEKGVYYGTRNPEVRSDYHKIVSTNPIHRDGGTCMGCHSHKENSHGFVVCQTESNNTLEQNCITCHMPQVPGSLSDRVNTPTHAYHGFASLDKGREYLQKYVDLNLSRRGGEITVSITNKAPHSLLLHPLRKAQLVVLFYKGDELIGREERDFERIIGKDGEATPPWVATEIVKDTMIKGGERRQLHLQIPPEATRVRAELYLYRLRPEIAEKLKIEDRPLLFKEEEIGL